MTKPREMPQRVSGRIRLGAIFLPIAYAGAFAALAFLADISDNGIVVWILLTGMILLGLQIVERLVRLVTLLRRRGSQPSPIWKKLRLAVLSLMVTLTIFEIFLEVQASLITYDPNHPPADRWLPPLTLPKAWEAQPVETEIDSGTLWHTNLHVFGRNQMRNEFIPARDPSLFRILVFGDSFTYGFGVAESDAYPAVLEQLMKDEYNVEVYNLGVYAYSTAEILAEMHLAAKHLSPSLVVYGVCLNDYQPKSPAPPLASEATSPLGLTGDVENWLTERTRVGTFFRERYQDVLIRLGSQHSYLGAVLQNFEQGRAQFEQNVRRMNELVVGLGLPPVVAMVLPHSPEVGSPEHQLVRQTEQILREAGMTVVPIETYIEEYHGQDMRVSRWEPHPNATAHREYAEHLAEALRELPELQAYKKTH